MNRDRRRRIAWLAVPLLAVASVGNALALTDEEIFREFRFNFISPGAHALGLGGAYISAATDATAAEANPAALHYVAKKEFFVEYRRAAPELQFLQPSIDQGSKEVGSTEDFFNFLSVNNREDRNFPSFVSFVYPRRFGKQRKRVTLAFSRQVVLDTETSLTLGGSGTDCSDPNVVTTRCTFLEVSLEDFPIIPNPPVVERYSVTNTVQGFLDAELVHYNVGFSAEITRDFSLGATATLAELSMDSLVDSLAIDPYPVLTSVHPRLGDPGDVSDIRRMTSIDDESDTAFAYTIGIHWHPDSVFPNEISPYRFGLVYRKGADLAVPERVQEFNAVSGQFEQIRAFDNVLRVPDRWGVGGSYHGDRWLFSVDVERIRYSDLLDGFVTNENFFTSDLFPETLLPGIQDVTFDVDDATVVHGGVEYSWASAGRWDHAVRAGYFEAQDNKIALKSVGQGVDPDVEAILFDLFRGGEDVDHFTVGWTLGFQGARSLVQFQLAGDFSDEGDEFVGSVKYQFGRTAR